MRRRPKPRSAPGGYEEPETGASGAGEEEFTQRATFYFSEEQLLQLEVAMLKLRTDQRLKVGKSEIMRAALDFILEDYQQNRENCWLVRRIKGET